MLTFIAEGHLLQCSLDFRSSELGARRVLPNYHASVGAVGGPGNANNRYTTVIVLIVSPLLCVFSFIVYEEFCKTYNFLHFAF